jgi:hypothetical protein
VILGPLQGGVQVPGIGAGEDDVEVTAAGAGKNEELAGGLEAGYQARDVTAAQAGLAGQGLEAGPGKAVIVGIVGQGEEQEQGGALLVGMFPDALAAVNAHWAS